MILHTNITIWQPMTYLKSKSDEAEQLLIQLRKNHYCFVIADNLPDIEEFITHFYNNLLQTKKWHIAKNNRWRVINFYIQADTYAECVELLLQKDHFSDRKVNLAFESETIKLLKSGKTSLNKLYKSYQYAYNYNYMFCIFPSLNQSPEALLQMIQEIHDIFIQASLSKTEPLYTLIGLTTHQKELIDFNKDYLQNIELNEENTWHLPGITAEEINNILSEFGIFTNAQPNIRENIINEILQSDDRLLQLKNTTRKLKVGILPTTEIPVTELKIKKDGVAKISIKSSEENVSEKQNREATIKAVPLKKKSDIDPEQLYRSLSTKYQMNNFLKIMLTLFQMTEDMQIQHQSIALSRISTLIDVPVKEIRKSLYPFVAKKVIIVEEEDDHSEVEILQYQEMYEWERLRTLLLEKAAFTELFKNIFETGGAEDQLKIYALNLTEHQWNLLKNEEKTFWLHFLISQQENITLLESMCQQMISYYPENVPEIKPANTPQQLEDNDSHVAEEKNTPKIAIKPKIEAEPADHDSEITEPKQIKFSISERTGDINIKIKEAEVNPSEEHTEPLIDPDIDRGKMPEIATHHTPEQPPIEILTIQEKETTEIQVSEEIFVHKEIPVSDEIPIIDEIPVSDEITVAEEKQVIAEKNVAEELTAAEALNAIEEVHETEEILVTDEIPVPEALPVTEEIHTTKELPPTEEIVSIEEEIVTIEAEITIQPDTVAKKDQLAPSAESLEKVSETTEDIIDPNTNTIPTDEIPDNNEPEIEPESESEEAYLEFNINKVSTGDAPEKEPEDEAAHTIKKTPFKIKPTKINPEQSDESEEFKPHRTKLTFKKKE